MAVATHFTTVRGHWTDLLDRFGDFARRLILQHTHAHLEVQAGITVTFLQRLARFPWCRRASAANSELYHNKRKFCRNRGKKHCVAISDKKINLPRNRTTTLKKKQLSRMKSSVISIAKLGKCLFRWGLEEREEGGGGGVDETLGSHPSEALDGFL